MAVITIARQFGAGGLTLGNLVAGELGYDLIDKQIVERVAEEANVSADWVDSVAKDAGSGGFLKRLISQLGPFRKGYDAVSMETKPGYLDGDLYISLLHRVLPQIAAAGDVVIIGRGGQYILADHPDSYHFLMIADMAHRIQFMMDHYDLDRQQAQLIVEKQSKSRLNLYRVFGRTDYDQPSLYHMVFNMNRVALDEAAKAVCQLVTGRGTS